MLSMCICACWRQFNVESGFLLVLIWIILSVTFDADFCYYPALVDVSTASYFVDLWTVHFVICLQHHSCLHIWEVLLFNHICCCCCCLTQFGDSACFLAALICSCIRFSFATYIFYGLQFCFGSFCFIKFIPVWFLFMHWCLIASKPAASSWVLLHCRVFFYLSCVCFHHCFWVGSLSFVICNIDNLNGLVKIAIEVNCDLKEKMHMWYMWVEKKISK